MSWSLSVGPGASADTPGPELDLTTARSAVLTRRVKGHHFAQFTISSAIKNGRLVDPLAVEERAAIALRESDLWMWRRSPLGGAKALLFRGRIVAQEVQTTADAWTGTFHAVDYRGLLTLAARIEGTIPTWLATAQSAIIWQLVQHRQAQAGGDWGITNGSHSGPAQNRDQTDLTAGKPIAEAIDALAQLENGFDWEITPGLVLNSWSPKRTRDQGVQMSYGPEVASYQGGTPEWANAATFTGADATAEGVLLTPVTVATAGVGTDQRGRWSAFGSSPNMTRQTSITSAANGLLDDVSVSNAQWAVELVAGMWDQLHDDDRGIDACDLGEIVNLVLGPDNVDGTCRVVEQQVTCGDDGDGSEVVRMGLVEE